MGGKETDMGGQKGGRWEEGGPVSRGGGRGRGESERRETGEGAGGGAEGFPPQVGMGEGTCKGRGHPGEGGRRGEADRWVGEEKRSGDGGKEGVGGGGREEGGGVRGSRERMERG